MGEGLLTKLAILPPELLTLVLAALPVTELRASIPLAVTILSLSPWQAFFWSVLGNCIPIFLCYALMPFFERWALGHSSRLSQAYTWYSRRLEERNRQSIERWGALALCLFVATPLPGTGAWTGSLLAIIFKIPPRLGIPAIIGGVIIAGLIVTLIVTGVLSGLRFLII